MSKPALDRVSEPTEADGVNDAREVASARAGDPGAFDRLVGRYQRRVVSVAYRLLGNAHDAADVAQDAFLRAYQNLDSLEDTQRFGPWLMRIVTNLALNYRRSRGRRAAVVEAGIAEGAESAALGTLSPHARHEDGQSAAVTTELRAATARAIEGLPEKQRLALLLFAVEGMPQKDVAEIMECSVELVKWNVFKARKTIREALGDLIE